MKVEIVAGFDGDMAPDLPMLTAKRWVGVRRDIDVAHLEKWVGEFCAYPDTYLLSILRSAVDCSPDQMVAESTPMAQALVRAGLVGRCGIEICNEPNISVDKDKRPTWAQDPVAFRTVVNACAQAIWAVNPRIDVVSGGVSNTGWKEQAWLARAVDGMHLDVVIGYHTYRQEDTPETPRGWFATRDAEDAALRAIFGSRRRMLTEFGWGEGPWQKKVLLPGVPLTLPPAWLDRLKAVTVKGSWTEQQVAEMAEREVKRAEANGAECAVWYQIRGGTGILRDDGTLKPVAEVAVKFWVEPPPPPPPETRLVSATVTPGGAKARLVADGGQSFEALTSDLGRLSFSIPFTLTGGADLFLEADGFEPYLNHVALDPELTVIPIEMTPKRPSHKRYSKAQLVDVQCDLLIWCPEVKPNFDENGWDAELQIRRRGNQPGNPVALGIEAGWVWCITVANYPAPKRQKIYAAAKALGHTHFALHVAELGPGPGYHGIYPISQSMADNYGSAMNTVHRELLDVGLIPVCFGVAPGAPPAPGFDCDQVLVAASDWDNTSQAASRIRAISEAFQHAFLFFELPAGNIWPDPSDDDPVPPNEGSSNPWIRGMRQRYDRFVGVMHEADISASVEDVVRSYTAKHAWWHDLPESQGELYTWNGFWQNWSIDEVRRRADAIAAQCPWLKGTVSGWTMRPPPPDEVIDGTTRPFRGDEINPAEIVAAGNRPFLTWPATAHITKLSLTQTGIFVEFTKKNEWPDVTVKGWDGPLRYSLGVVLKIRGQWYAGAPIECWWRPDYIEFGGPIQNRNMDGTGIGQIARNWFYAAPIPATYRWDEMAGYQPAPGEEFGFFVVAGSVRNSTYAVYERSAIVKIQMPAGDAAASFAWSTE